MTSLVCWFLQGHFCSIWNSSPYLQIPPWVHECFPSRVHWAARFNVIYDLAYLTDCGQPASEHSSESLQQVDEAEMSTKNEDKYNFMDLPVREVAEQLTRLDAVGFVFIKNWSSVFLGWLWEGGFFSHKFFPVLWQFFPPGPVCQSGALPLPGLRLVPTWQKRKPKPGTNGPRHHLPV